MCKKHHVSNSRRHVQTMCTQQVDMFLCRCSWRVNKSEKVVIKAAVKWVKKQNAQLTSFQEFCHFSLSHDFENRSGSIKLVWTCNSTAVLEGTSLLKTYFFYQTGRRNQNFKNQEFCFKMPGWIYTAFETKFYERRLVGPGIKKIGYMQHCQVSRLASCTPRTVWSSAQEICAYVTQGTRSKRLWTAAKPAVMNEDVLSIQTHQMPFMNLS